MKRAFQYLLLILLIAGCQPQYECTTLGCQVVEQSSVKKKKKETFFKKSRKNKLRRKPQKGLFKRGVLPKFKNTQ